MEVIGKAALGLAVNYAVHYSSATFYHEFCVPHNFEEILQTLVTTASPICSMALTVTQMTQSSYGAILTTTLTGAFTNSLKVF